MVNYLGHQFLLRSLLPIILYQMCDQGTHIKLMSTLVHFFSPLSTKIIDSDLSCKTSKLHVSLQEILIHTSHSPCCRRKLRGLLRVAGSLVSYYMKKRKKTSFSDLLNFYHLLSPSLFTRVTLKSFSKFIRQ